MNEPLRENEVGRFFELAQRPNPGDLVIMAVPPLEGILASVRDQLGRDLTPEEIELHRRNAISIVVNSAVAEKMKEARSSRAPAIHGEPARRNPEVAGVYEDMPSEPRARKEAAVELFGQHLFALRKQLSERVRHFIEADESRKRLGSLHRKEYDAVAALGPDERYAALSLARKAIDLYMQDILALLTGRGNSLQFGPAHAINYRLVLEVKDVTSNEVVEEFDVNRECEKVFYEYYGRWLNRYASET